MMIPVCYLNGSFDRVSADVLERLLAQKEIFKFRRSSGWVVVGQERTRGMGGPSYGGRERRMLH